MGMTLTRKREKSDDADRTVVASRLMVKFNGVVWFIIAKLRLRHC